MFSSNVMPKNFGRGGIAKAHEQEGVCRVCGLAPVQAAHLVHRSQGAKGFPTDLTVPLCYSHHLTFDEGKLELLPFLSQREQSAVVALIGLERAYKRLTAAGPRL